MSDAVTVKGSGDNIQYKDRKRYFWLLSPVWVMVPAISIYMAYVTGLEWLVWSTVAIWYFVLPAMDWALGSDPNNPPPEAIEKLERERYYRYLTYVTVPLHYVALVVGAWAVANLGLSWLGYLGVALSVGIINGLAINTGHELGHKKTDLEKTLSKICLAVVGYGHFHTEHNKGHHKDVATPEDPASARFGESIYRFALREIPGAFRRAWNTEKTRLARKGKGPWTPDNDFLQPLLITVVLYAALVAYFGVVIVPYLLIAMAMGYWFLTSANYIEHYGLLRQKEDSGRYERCKPHHSWNSNHIMSNLILFHLQRHSDHHAWPTRRYQSLRSFDDVPTLPSGYPGMYALALIPPLWRAVMDRRVLALYDGDVTKVNLDPAKRDRILRRHAGQAA
ncbi:alkane 1-monooxygenase [Salinisphaera sp. PC39]|uniref:alkane 1-monooxygenase n=1 Tax=Salinisphaera sp. PC39 TaxID=1304156 RepID=UPI00333F106B